MEEILKTNLLESSKSSFIIDLVKHTNGKVFIRISQTINEEYNELGRAININPSFISDFINILTTFQELIPQNEEKETIVNISNASKTSINTNSNKIEKKRDIINEIINRYLKMVSIEELAIQFDCNREIILQILRENEIEIVNNKFKTQFYKRFNTKKKK